MRKTMLAPTLISLFLALVFIGTYLGERQDRKRTHSKEDKFFSNWSIIAFWIALFFTVVFALGLFTRLAN
ncbi:MULTISPECIES: hypothetical protein [unclassified Arthrobacter]|uniref:hypothetical protein n=1 Tax=unclassified Arthrobacter TaxID=235627 RepID=UPI0011B0B6A4|nr:MULTISPECIES: hypothetical protein [unclassified Arthrobacter]